MGHIEDKSDQGYKLTIWHTNGIRPGATGFLQGNADQRIFASEISAVTLGDCDSLLPVDSSTTKYFPGIKYYLSTKCEGEHFALTIDFP
jgi:hypothetical protein